MGGGECQSVRVSGAARVLLVGTQSERVRNRQRVGHKSILTYVVFVCSVSPTTCHRREIGHNRQTKCAMQLQCTLEVVASTSIACAPLHCVCTASIMNCTLQTYNTTSMEEFNTPVVLRRAKSSVQLSASHPMLAATSTQWRLLPWHGACARPSWMCDVWSKSCNLFCNKFEIVRERMVRPAFPFGRA